MTKIGFATQGRAIALRKAISAVLLLLLVAAPVCAPLCRALGCETAASAAPHHACHAGHEGLEGHAAMMSPDGALSHLSRAESGCDLREGQVSLAPRRAEENAGAQPAAEFSGAQSVPQCLAAAGPGFVEFLGSSPQRTSLDHSSVLRL